MSTTSEVHFERRHSVHHPAAMRRLKGLAALLLLAVCSGAWAQGGPFLYAVKFVCGSHPKIAVVAPGTYYTAINVNNPTPQIAEFRKRFSLALPEERPGPVSPWVGARLESDQSFEIDCPDILRHLELPAQAFAKGFVIVESPVELELVAVYTATGSTRQVEAMDVERVTPRQAAVR
jgi:hypothetical protein